MISIKFLRRSCVSSRIIGEPEQQVIFFKEPVKHPKNSSQEPGHFSEGAG